ncbi:MAG: hypothetical protein IKI31_04730, partial [Treponema sp.]|nr:hypothetical protein [Treponema sp.]
MKKNVIFSFILSVLFFGCATEANFKKTYYISNTQVNIGENSGKVTVTVNIQNMYASDKETELVCRVLDHNRKPLGKASLKKIMK